MSYLTLTQVSANSRVNRLRATKHFNEGIIMENTNAPVTKTAGAESEFNAGLEDMTLLDYFAARALPAVIALPDDEWPFDFTDAYDDGTCHSDHIALAAYTYAEAMLRARKRLASIDSAKRIKIDDLT